MAEMALSRIETLEQTAQGCLTQAALFRKYLTDGPDTALIQKEYDGLCAMLAEILPELCALARSATEQVDFWRMQAMGAGPVIAAQPRRRR